MRPLRVVTISTLAAAALAFFGAMALIGHQRTETYRLVNQETIAMLERANR